MVMGFPVSSRNERELPPEWRGEVFVCDIDRTYLYTRFSTMKGLAQIPFEFAIDKRGIEGMAPLLREVRRGPERESRQTPLYFISASPAQLRGVIERKMLLDGLEFDGTIFKDWLGVLASLRFKRFREQVGFKLTALLQHRRDMPIGATNVLLGDDLEADPLTFALFADVTAGRLRGPALGGVLEGHGVAADDAQSIVDLAAALPEVEGTRRGYIRLERSRDAQPLHRHWPHIVGCRDTFQIAASLWRAASISLRGLVRVVAEHHRPATAAALARSLEDACCRALLERDEIGPLIEELLARRLLGVAPELPPADPRWAEPLRQPREAWA